MSTRHERAPEGAGALECATTSELLTELKRRCLACMVVCVRVEAGGDAWHYALKGSPLLLGAMSAALQLKTAQKLAAEHARGDDGLQGSGFRV
ncbi:MAG: hypothetical protein NTW87_04270 [Planctomycetota bacterium]|nr:hypothetical protein [Planctomycetota bacterium]